MMKCNVRIEDRHFQEIHHALGCPWPDEVRGETYRDHFCAGNDTETAARMRASPHWTNGAKSFGSWFFYVTDEGRKALAEYMAGNVETPARYTITYHHHEGEDVVAARSRSAAKYAAYMQADVDWPFAEFLAGVKSVRLHSKGNHINTTKEAGL